jgi:3-hydroxyacyl-CoA dehydrogenase
MSVNTKVAIVGAGLVGGGWAIAFARAGYDVALFDAMPGAAEKARGSLLEQLVTLAEAGMLADAPETVGARMRIAADLADALDGVGYVQESVLEVVDVKRSVFAQMEPHLPPDAMVGSSSSGMPASLYTDHVNYRDRCLLAHPVNPPYLIPVVELVPAPWTAPTTLSAVRELMERIGQAPVTLTREIDGFVLNRLQAVLLMEAWRLVESGVATVQDIDLTISQGLGLRWAFMGPFETIDLNAPGGVADYAARLGALYQGIAASTAEHKVWDADLIARVEAQRRETLPASDLAERRDWRDRNLMALSTHLAKMRDRLT